MMIRLLKTWFLLLPLVLLGPLVRYGLAETASGPSASATDILCARDLRPQDSLWMISTRHLGCPDPQNPGLADFRTSQYDGYQWQESDFPTFQHDRRDLTVFFVHGNRVDGTEVYQRGLDAYLGLTRGLDDPRSIRFVVWSWPSTQIRGPRRDVLVKAARTNADAYYLATVLAGLPETELSLFGFSFGARIVSGALHLVGGGRLCGYQLMAGEALPALHPRIVLMAAAMHRSWWLPDGFHSQCPYVADKLLVQYNPCDPVLKLYPRIDWRRRPQALGYTGFPWTGQLGPNADKLQQQNVCCQVGKTHDATRYFDSFEVMSRARECLLGYPMP